MPKTKTPSKPKTLKSPESSKEGIHNALELIQFMSETGLAELDVETPHLKMSLKKHSPLSQKQMVAVAQNLETVSMAAAPVSKKSVGKPEVKAVAPAENYHKIVSPMAGTFYKAPSPSSPSYVKEGDQITAGQPICIIEAMKLMNEIKADKTGKVVKILLDNAQSVEKGTVLFWVEAKA